MTYMPEKTAYMAEKTAYMQEKTARMTGKTAYTAEKKPVFHRFKESIIDWLISYQT